ncbi:protein serine/threonine phosphatase [sediment metagenome]|uniref:Protein serine/threonine phosphatase n=1 Tax=sediment metagenome TaxID=749907 RepID=D9PM68_9ZZZZ
MIGDDLEVKTSGISDVGLKREGNEDSFLVDDSLGLYVVCDGMGGHLAGEVASQISVEIIRKTFRKWVEEGAGIDEIYGKPDYSLSIEGNYLLGCIRLANHVVYEMATENKQYHGMGTTVVIVLVTHDLIITANVGDSRIYLIRDSMVEGLSKDHTIVAEQVEMGMMTEEEAATSPMKHILTRNIGSSEYVVPDIFEIEPANNDRFILCSDGLTDLVNEDEILEMTEEEDTPENLCKRLIDVVLDRGAHDNTTIISIFLSDIRTRKEGIFRKTGFLFADFFNRVQKTIKNIIP